MLTGSPWGKIPTFVAMEAKAEKCVWTYCTLDSTCEDIFHGTKELEVDLGLRYELSLCQV